MRDVRFHKIMGYNDNFYVSEYGLVYSVKDGDYLPTFLLNNGRTAVNIEWNGRTYMYVLDKLVVNAFFAFPFECMGKPILDIEHKNGDLTDNCVWNLDPILKDVEYENDVKKKEKKKTSTDSKKTALDFIEGISKRVKTDSTTDEFVESQQAKVAKTILNDAKS